MLKLLNNPRFQFVIFYSSIQSQKISITLQKEKLDIFCQRCEILTCRDCQLSSAHDGHDCLPAHEVAQEVKVAVAHAQGDLSLKRNLLDENRAMLGSKLGELNIKVLNHFLWLSSSDNGSFLSQERSLMRQIADVKNYLVKKVETRFRELTNEVSKSVREKRKAIEGRKSNLDRLYIQVNSLCKYEY